MRRCSGSPTTPASWATSTRGSAPSSTWPSSCGQPFLAWLLVKLPIGKFTSATVLLWGATLACMAAAHTFSGLMTSRFFLGAFEAGVAPSFIAVTQMWWRRREQTVRISYWYAMNGVTNMFGSLITYGLGHVHSSLRPYQVSTKGVGRV